MSTYQIIEKAALEIAYDGGNTIGNPNLGGLTEEQFLENLRGWLRERPTVPLQSAEIFLKGLSEADLETVCSGEESDADAIFSRGGFCGREARALLIALFEEVVCA